MCWPDDLLANVAEGDLLIVDEIGKNVSGAGMDTNVIGRKYNDHSATDNDGVRVRRIFVRGLTSETHGNACGLGMAEITNRRPLAEIDQSATAINALTGGHPSAAGMPIALETDRDCLEAIIPTIGLTDPENARVVHITPMRLPPERTSRSLKPPSRCSSTTRTTSSRSLLQVPRCTPEEPRRITPAKAVMTPGVGPSQPRRRPRSAGPQR